MKYKLRPDQKTIKNEILDVFEHDERVVLGAVTGFGKTIVAWDIIRTLARQNKRVLVLTHGRIDIRDNFRTSIARLPNACVINSSKDIPASRNAQSVIAIPQTIGYSGSSMGKIDMVIVDEAHQFYDGRVEQRILQKLKAENKDLKQLLLTATHYRFKNVPKILYSRERALESNHIANASISMLEIPCRLTASDFTPAKELKGSLNIDSKIEQSMDIVMNTIGDNPRKSIMITHSIDAADFVCNVLKRRYNTSVGKSHSECDKRSEEVERFKQDNSLKLLVVVNRANLGFDCPRLQYVIDLTMSRNVERIEQMFGRLLRKYKNTKKNYIKAYSQDDITYYQTIMSGVLALSLDDVYSNWDGSLDTLPILMPGKSTGTRSCTQGKHLILHAAIWDFAQYITLFRKGKTTTLADAIKKCRRMPEITFSYDACMEIASDFKSLTDWSKRNPRSYAFACKLQWQKKIAKQLGWRDKKWRRWVTRRKKKFTSCSYDSLKSRTSKYTSLPEWRNNNFDEFVFALKNNWHKKIAAAHGWPAP